MSIDLSKIERENKGSSVDIINFSFLNKSIFQSKKISDKEKAFIYKDLATLLSAGIDLKKAFTIIIEQQKKEKTKEVINSILKNIIKGKDLYKSMEEEGQFTPYEIFSVKIGEETHRLDQILEELYSYFKRKVKLKKQIISILTYPAFILVLTFATLYFMLTYVVPLFDSVFNQFNRELPALTRYVIFLSENFTKFLLLFLGVIFVMFLIYKKIKNSIKFKDISSKLILKIPFFGKLIKEIYITRFCQSMALLMVSKTSLIESLGLVKKMIGFHPITHAIDQIEVDIRRGYSLGDSLSKFSFFDSNITSMVKVAEEVNELDAMFFNLSDHYNEEVEHKTKVMGSVIEPMLILFIGGIVGVIMVSMYAPMFDLSKVIGSN